MIEAYRRFNQPVPKELEPPSINDTSQPYWRAYCDLVTESRDGVIPWSSIVFYAKYNGFQPNDLIDIVRIVDSAKMNSKTAGGKNGRGS